MYFKLFVVLYLLLVPSSAFAWGPLTHVYLGSEVLYFSSVLPAAVYGLIKRYRQDYLYGNLMADMILAKKYLPKKSNPHSWDVALSLHESAKTAPEKAFSLGYMSHLAADTVAHGDYTAGAKNIGHAILELKADSFIDRSYWFKAVAIEGRVQKRNDQFLERSLERVIFSFKTNKRIFKGAVALSFFNGGNFRPLGPDNGDYIEGLREESLDRIIDVLKHGDRSAVLKEDPLGKVKKSRVINVLLS